MACRHFTLTMQLDDKHYTTEVSLTVQKQLLSPGIPRNRPENVSTETMAHCNDIPGKNTGIVLSVASLLPPLRKVSSPHLSYVCLQCVPRYVPVNVLVGPKHKERTPHPSHS